MRIGLTLALLAAIGCNSNGDDDTKDTDPTCVGEGCDPVDDDRDDDGFTVDDDCDDDDPDVNPDADEVPYDGIDQDCAGGDLVDVDEDGYVAIEAGGDDCDDTDEDTYPGAGDTVGDGIDRSCDGIDGEDGDGDGHASVASGGLDCDDGDAARNPDAAEIWYDGVDQNCDRVCDYDQDGDGAVEPGSPVSDNSVCDADPFPGRVDAPEDCDDTDAAFIDQQVAASVPTAGAIEVSISTPVSVTLEEEDPSATLVVLDPDGAPVPGATWIALTELLFTPDTPFLEQSTYTVEVAHGCGAESWSFTTRAPAVPVDPTSLVDRVWEFDLGSGNWTQPPSIGPLLGAIATVPVRLSVPAESGGTLDVRIGLGTTAGGQDLCSPTNELVGVDFTANPELAFGPTDIAVDVSGAAITVTGAFAGGRFTPDASAIVDLSLDGNIDTRPLVDFIAPGGPPDSVCLLVATFGVTCTACPDGTGNYCLDARVEDLIASEVPGPLVPRTDADILADPSCP